MFTILIKFIHLLALYFELESKHNIAWSCKVGNVGGVDMNFDNSRGHPCNFKETHYGYLELQ